jgi:hypothetical protein
VILLRRVIDRHEAFFGNAAMRPPDRRNDRVLPATRSQPTNFSANSKRNRLGGASPQQN